MLKRRYIGFQVLLVLMFAVLAAQLYRMQILDGQNYDNRAKGNRERLITVKADRGIIYDRTGVRLVANNPSYSIAITPVDLPDDTTAEGKVARNRVFAELKSLLGTQDVITITPKDLPAEKVGEVANRLSVLLQINAELLRGPLNKLMADHPHAENPLLLRSDIPEAASTAIRGQFQFLPGVQVYNELEYNYITRFERWLNAVTVKSGVDYNTMVKVDVDRPNLPGVSVVPEPVRQYAGGPLFSHLLGYVGPIDQSEYDAAQAKQPSSAPPIYGLDDKVGKTGLEESLEPELRGVKGSARVVVNSNERVVSEISSTAPITGNNVTLTIDARLQMSVTAALSDGLKKANAKAGAAIVMRVSDGQVLSMVSLPSYDNNLFANGISQTNFDMLNNDTTLPMFDRAIGGTYPPGSTFKMITAAAALQESIVAPDTIVACPGFIEIPTTWNEKLRNRFKDWKAAGHGNINIVQALTVSSDVFFYIMAGPRQQDDRGNWTRYYAPWAAKPSFFNGLGIAKIHDYSAHFGLGKKTGIELPGEASGVAPDPSWKLSNYPDNPWSIGDTVVTAIGQGFDLVTPLQLVNVTSAVANGGTLYKPQLVLNVTDPSGKVVQGYQPQVLGKVPVSAQNLAIVRQGMHDVVADKIKGTAYRITIDKVSGIQVAGKTGTAEYGENLVDDKGHSYKRSHAWFTAFAPFDNPEIAVVTLIEGGDSALEGSTYAVPVTDEILKAYFHVNK